MAGTITKTVKSSGGDYTTLVGWEAGEQGNLVTATEIRQAQVYAFNEVLATSFIIDGSTTSASFYLRVFCAPKQCHAGKFDTTKYYMTIDSNAVASSSGISVRDNNVVIEDIQVDVINAPAGASLHTCVCQNVSSGGVMDWKRLIVRGNASWNNGATCRGFSNLGSSNTINIYNCLVYDYLNALGTGVCIQQAQTGSTINAYNCTLANSKTGMAQSNGTLNGTNIGNTATTATSGTVTLTTSSSSTPSYVNASGKDFHLLSYDTTWKGGGTDLSATFTDDIDARTRTGAWDIGADQANPGPPAPHFHSTAYMRPQFYKQRRRIVPGP